MPKHSLYNFYGACLRSQWALPYPHYPKANHSGLAEVDLYEESKSYFQAASGAISSRSRKHDDWFHCTRLKDGTDYVRWTDLFEFLISPDGRRIAGRALNGTPAETFQTYLLSQVLSFALLKQGIEPLHGTVVIVGDEAVAFLGHSGFGKSTLAATFLQIGHQLLTDDLLVVERRGSRFFAYPGLPRIKLFPKAAQAFLGDHPGSLPMNPDTAKLVIPLPSHRVARAPHPLKAIYVLRPPTSDRTTTRTIIRALSPRKACLALIANTFNTIVQDSHRLQRQFSLATSLAESVPVKSLSHPLGLNKLPMVVHAIEKDLTR